ncbi:CPBP family glutamic-type intramembrane protease [Mucilaginibacter celer]|uniref:CPBP family intramembrane metalloprotease n=1 Tax=Mucilaginibacter celer TaxID=2305508 RepID=A0A494VRI7_9SPHI|nr:CPBP family glutamic-type intramembrane protease [Mucilaginibacter celer]AYL95980.1 CPBP family intramembrane metalloprotease [Mucilaginibacter celer]
MITEEQEISQTRYCSQCGALNFISVRFCGSCGHRQSEINAEQSRPNNWQQLQQAALFYGINILVCALSSFVNYFKDIGWSLIVEVVIAGTAVIFFAYNWDDCKKLLRWPSFSWQKLAGYCAIAMIGGVIVHYSVTWINVTVFSRDGDYYSTFKGLPGGAFLLIFFLAVTPALFEELGFRGYLLKNLLNIADTGQAVFMSAFLFAIIHFSFISLFWLIPFALLLGYTRVKENTIWYGICIHFCFNLTACLFELL